MSSIFWDIMPCNSVNVSQHFEGIYHFHLHGWRVSQARSQYEADSKQCVQTPQDLHRLGGNLQADKSAAIGSLWETEQTSGWQEKSHSPLYWKGALLPLVGMGTQAINHKRERESVCAHTRVCVWGGSRQRNEKGEGEVIYVGCRHAAWDIKSKKQHMGS
jgi:hypothetical protein